MNRFEAIFGGTGPESRGERLGMRVVELAALLFLVRSLFVWLVDLAHIAVIVTPVGIGREVDLTFLLTTWAAAINATAATALFAYGFVRERRGVYLVALVLVHLAFAARHGLGKIPHDTNLAGLVVLAHGLAPFVDADPVLRRRTARGLTLVFVALAYTLAGIAKVVTTGPTWVKGSHLALWIAEKSIDVTARDGSHVPNLAQRILVDSPALATVLLTGSLLLELGAATLLVPRLRPFVLASLLLMHVGIGITMQIDFLGNEVVLVALLLPIRALVDTYDARRARRAAAGDSGNVVPARELEVRRPIEAVVDP